MKKSLYIVGKIIAYIGFGLGSLLAFAYFVMNLRLLFSGDYSIYANPAAGFFNTLFRLLTYLVFISAGVFSYIYLIKKNKEKYQTLFIVLSTSLYAIILVYAVLINIPLDLSIEGKLIFTLTLSLLIGNFGNSMYLLNQISDNTPNTQNKD
ncbi:MAG: DUF1772 domain-containing protein [Bacilli bacterium]|nr:DUF1772 domain-containing protein [Bacilli bacterium]